MCHVAGTGIVTVRRRGGGGVRKRRSEDSWKRTGVGGAQSVTNTGRRPGEKKNSSKSANTRSKFYFNQ